MENEFRKRMRYEAVNPERQIVPTSRSRQQIERGNTRGYHAPKGTLEKANNNRKRRKNKRSARAASMLLALAIGLGVAGFTQANNKEPVMSVTQIMETGVAPQNLGLSEETLEAFSKYDEYFKEFDGKNAYNLTDETVISMISEIEDLHFAVIKEKMADLRGVDPKDVKMYYSFERGDGQYHTSITIKEDSYFDKETYSNSSGFLGLGKENHIPAEMTDVITQLEDLDSIISRLKADKISKVNAIKELKKLYRNVEKVATSQLIMDEKGNISLLSFSTPEKEQEQNKEEQER